MKRLTIIAFLFTSSFALAKGNDCSNYDKYTNVTKTEMKKIVDTKSATIIDVNSKKVFTENGIPGAIHFASNQKTFAKVLPTDKTAPIIAYCGGEMCTAWQKAAQKACEMGYTNIKHFSAGAQGWKEMTQKSGAKKG